MLRRSSCENVSTQGIKSAATLAPCSRRIRHRRRRSQNLAEGRCSRALLLLLLLVLSRDLTDLLAHLFGVDVPVAHLLGDLGRNAAPIAVFRDVADHFGFALRKCAKQLARLGWRRAALACLANSVAALLGFLTQRNELFHARFAAGRACLLLRSPEAARNRRRARGRERAWRADRRCRRLSVDRRERRPATANRRKRRGRCRDRRSLPWQWRRECTLRPGLDGMQGEQGYGQRHNRTTDAHRNSSGWMHGVRVLFKTVGNLDLSFYDPCPGITTRGICQEHGVSLRRIVIWPVQTPLNANGTIEMPDVDFRSPRLYVEANLAADAPVALDRNQSNYLGNVLRLGNGDRVLVFNGRDGEWLAVVDAGKRIDRLVVQRQIRAQDALPDVAYVFALLKHARLDYMVQKAVEMGAGALQPVITRFTQINRVNTDRMRANVIEAAEQCGILGLASVAEPLALGKFLEQRSADRLLVFCDESADTSDPAAALAGQAAHSGGIDILIGPEGGFSPEERERLLAQPKIARLALGPRILRADTAAVAALTLVQTVLGDWRGVSAQS